MQKFGLQLVAPPLVEPVSLALAKSHLRVDYALDDAYISSLISVAREHAERIMRRAIFSQTWQLSLDAFPCGADFTTIAPYTRDNFYGCGLYLDWTSIALPVPRLQGVTSITYLDGYGNQQTVDPTTYIADTRSEPARIMPVNGSLWPFPPVYTPGSVVVTYVTGTFGDGVLNNTCPRSIMQAILLLVGHWYVNREAASSVQMSNVPFAVDALLNSYRFFGLTY